MVWILTARGEVEAILRRKGAPGNKRDSTRLAWHEVLSLLNSFFYLVPYIFLVKCSFNLVCTKC